ncbi:hypothetical protein COCNU_scaffold003048G000010 [Cocos nucifera]|nr:hypothetical protein [Cocos nucifera]
MGSGGYWCPDGVESDGGDAHAVESRLEAHGSDDGASIWWWPHPDPMVACGSKPARWHGPSSSSRCMGSSMVEQGTSEVMPRSDDGGPRTMAVTCHSGDLAAAALGSGGRA